MRTVWRSPGLVALTLLSLAAWPGAGRADFLSFSGSNSLGSFDGTFDYTATDATTATLAVVLENTTPGATGGFLTAFAFNNPGGRITGTTLATPHANFTLLGGPGYDNGVDGSPFGHFDLGAGLGGSFEGGGPPEGGIGAGDTGQFTFTLTGTGLDQLTAQSFFLTLSAPPGDGNGAQAFVARFRGFANGGSDKVPGTVDDVTPVPEPGTLTLCSIGLLGVLAYGWRCRPRARGPAGAG